MLLGVSAVQLLPFIYFPLHYPREQAHETGAVVSDYRSGIVADGLGGENISHCASADGDN